VYFTARVAVRCLRNPEITAWVTPPPPDRRLAEFDPAGFPTSRQTLYLLSKDGGGSAGPLVAALTDRVLRADVVSAERRAGRLDPPLAVLLDEAANICKIGDLPQLYSHLGSRGIVVLTILQPCAQGVAVWGQTGMRALWSAATVKIVGLGMDDADFAEECSRLIGDHDVAVDTHTATSGSWSRSPRQQRVLPRATHDVAAAGPRRSGRCRAAGRWCGRPGQGCAGRHPPLVRRAAGRRDRRRPARGRAGHDRGCAVGRRPGAELAVTDIDHPVRRARARPPRPAATPHGSRHAAATTERTGSARTASPSTTRRR
jgi:TraM recognition site of TraD and TraG